MTGILDLSQQTNQFLVAALGTILIMWTVFADKLPVEVRWQLSTTIGRLLLLLVLYIVFLLAGWIPALLFTIAIALTWANRPLFKPTSVPEEEEGFDDMKVTIVEDKDEHRWFAEKVLEENTKVIIQDRVKTEPVQDNSQSYAGRVSR
jgi:hypothetical protein